jgi:hypothetical protein
MQSWAVAAAVGVRGARCCEMDGGRAAAGQRLDGGSDAGEVDGQSPGEEQLTCNVWSHRRFACRRLLIRLPCLAWVFGEASSRIMECPGTERGRVMRESRGWMQGGRGIGKGGRHGRFRCFQFVVPVSPL